MVIRKCAFITSTLMLCVAAYADTFHNRYTTGEGSTQIGRYSTVSNRPTLAQIDPLMAVAEFRFQPSVQTVGDAVAEVLQNSGYTLVPNAMMPAVARETLSKPLPITDRLLGPLSIREALLVLMGHEVFDLVVDPAHRLVNFHLKKRIARALGQHKGRHHHAAAH